MMEDKLYDSVRNPRATADPDQYDCDVVFSRIGTSPVQFTAQRVDPSAPYSEEIFADIKSGRYGPIAPYIPPSEPGPEAYELSKRQIIAALIKEIGITDIGGFIRVALDAIDDPVERALAENDWENAPYYSRDHQLFNDPSVLSAVDLTPEQVDGLWMMAKDLPK